MTQATQDILQRSLDMSEQLTLPTPRFEFRLGWTSDYEHLLARSYSGSWTVTELLDAVLQNGRVILHGAGGAGKSTVADYAIKIAAERRVAPLIASLRLWTPEFTDIWTERPDEASRVAMLLRFASPPTDEPTIAALGQDTDCLLVIDGLNEVPTDVARELLPAIDALARRNPRTGVLVTDRLTRRALPGEQWVLAAITSVIVPNGAAIVRDARTPQLPESALFLDLRIRRARRSGETSLAAPASTSSAGLLHDFFSEEVGLGPDEIETASAAALGAYVSERSRRFDLAQFVKIAGEATTTKLRKGDALLVRDRKAYFAHHLYHDYLAGSALAVGDASAWTHATFDAVTFGASSFEALTLALEQITDAPKADQFLLSVYDWNFYASAHALARGRSEEATVVTNPLELALLALLGERRWDFLLETQQQIHDALRAFPGEHARAILQASRLEDIIKLVQEAQHTDADFHEWKKVFIIPRDSRAPRSLITVLEGESSLRGWTASNVLKRTALSLRGQYEIRKLLRKHPIDVVRWRAAHTLGAYGKRPNANALLRALEDEYVWVRAGAVRSLVEIAATNDGSRKMLLKSLEQKAAVIIEDQAVTDWLRNALLLSSPPAGWEHAVAPLVETMWALAPTVEEQERWRERGYRILTRARNQRD